MSFAGSCSRAAVGNSLSSQDAGQERGRWWVFIINPSLSSTYTFVLEMRALGRQECSWIASQNKEILFLAAACCCCCRLDARCCWGYWKDAQTSTPSADDVIVVLDWEREEKEHLDLCVGMFFSQNCRNSMENSGRRCILCTIEIHLFSYIHFLCLTKQRFFNGIYPVGHKIFKVEFAINLSKVLAPKINV